MTKSKPTNIFTNFLLIIKFCLKRGGIFTQLYTLLALIWLLLFMLPIALSVLFSSSPDFGVAVFAVIIGLVPFIPIKSSFNKLRTHEKKESDFNKLKEKYEIEGEFECGNCGKTMMGKRKFCPYCSYEIVEEADLEIEFNTPNNDILVGKKARIYVKFKNNTDYPLNSINLSCKLSDTLGSKSNTINMNFLGPHDEVQEYWEIQPKKAGTFTIFKPQLKYEDIESEFLIVLDSFKIKVVEAPKSVTKVKKLTQKTKGSKKPLYSPWCPECQKYKGRQAECPHCGNKEE